MSILASIPDNLFATRTPMSDRPSPSPLLLTPISAALPIVVILHPIGARWRPSVATAISGVQVIAGACLITPVVWIAEAAIGRTQRKGRTGKNNTSIFRPASVARGAFPRAEKGLDPPYLSVVEKSFAVRILIWQHRLAPLCLVRAVF